MPAPQSLPPQAVVMQLLASKMAGQALSQIAELGIADLLKNGPRPVSELAANAQANEDALYRALRALAAFGFFTEHPHRTFANNPNSELLRTGVPGSLRAMARWLGEENSWWKAWGHLSYSLRTGQSAAEITFGSNAFEFMTRNPRVNSIFQAAMSDFSSMTARAVCQAYDFTGINHIVDVGGGHGYLLSSILDKVPQATGTLFDLPEVIENADPTLKATGNFNRITKAGGNFLDGVPANADAYIMKHIIHDWDDPRCVKILQHCKNGLRPNGRILIVEQVLSDAPESAFAKVLDLEMLVITPGGRERTAEDFQHLLNKAGLHLSRIVPTESPVCIIEALAHKDADRHTSTHQNQPAVATAYNTTP
ncbi:MAG: methyltransferase [Limisphaerales bacterium]